MIKKVSMCDGWSFIVVIWKSRLLEFFICSLLMFLFIVNRVLGGVGLFLIVCVFLDCFREIIYIFRIFVFFFFDSMLCLWGIIIN